MTEIEKLKSHIKKLKAIAGLNVKGIFEKTDKILTILENKEPHNELVGKMSDIVNKIISKEESVYTLKEFLDENFKDTGERFIKLNEKMNEDKVELLKETEYIQKSIFSMSGFIKKYFDNLKVWIEKTIDKKPSWYKEPNDVLMFKMLEQMAKQPGRTDQEVIDDLQQELNEREKKMWAKIKDAIGALARQNVRIPGGGLSRSAIIELISGTTGKRADLSSQCNGTKKTFNIPEGFVAGSISLQGTQFPVIYRPTTDFTEDTDNNQITLTSEVGAPKTGQTLVAIYEETKT